MGYALTLARRLSLLAMTPRGDLASTGYCLANPSAQNGEYVVYLPDGGAANVDLSGTPGTLAYEWIVPSSGQVILAGTITGGGVRTFNSSFLQSDAVLYIHR